MVIKLPIIWGRDTMDTARMMGMTPDMLTLIGMKVFCPPYIFRPTTRLAYWTGMRRSALVMSTISAIMARNSTRMMGTKITYFRPVPSLSCWIPA